MAEWHCGAPIGTLRRECLDHMAICGEAHLRRILSSYAGYYNETRTHLALQKVHRNNGLSNSLAGSPLFPSWPVYITDTSGYDFRKGQVIFGEAHLRRFFPPTAA